MKLIPHIRNIVFAKLCNSFLFLKVSKVFPSYTKPTETVNSELTHNSVLIFEVYESRPNQMKSNGNIQSISRTYCIRLNPVDTHAHTQTHNI